MDRTKVERIYFFTLGRMERKCTKIAYEIAKEIAVNTILWRVIAEGIAGKPRVL